MLDGEDQSLADGLLPRIDFVDAADGAGGDAGVGESLQPVWTNDQPPLFNKLDVNALLPAFIDGEHSMAWITDRFNGLPSTPNCDQV